MKILSLLSLAVVLVLSSCVDTSGGATQSGGEKRVNQEGWIGTDKYVLNTVGLWDRNRYYISGGTAEAGKTAKPSIGLQNDAKRAAQLGAMRNFLEKAVGASIKSKTGTEDGALIADVIQSGVEGKVPQPEAKTENYTPENDCRVVFVFEAKGLKKIIDDATAEILKKKGM